MSEINTHIEDFLKYYSDLSFAPQYAVLIKGKWGTGKTHLVDRFFKTYIPKSSGSKPRELNHLYVSLYGLTSTQEIEDAFFTQLHPLLSSKGAHIAGKIFKGLLKASIKVDLDGDKKTDANISAQAPVIALPDYLKNTNQLPIVFDDLERCSIPIKDILGYINAFVEHEDCKVIILADEDKILENGGDDYIKIKEKLIGKTFEVRAEFEAAFNHFLEAINSTSIKKLYQSNMSEIQLIFDRSKARNLRTLQRTMWDFERFSKALTTVHKAHNQAMKDIYRVFFALSFELKKGRLPHERIIEFSRLFWGKEITKDKVDKLPFTQEIKKRYPEVPFDQTILGYDVLANILGNSIIDKTKIHTSLDQHHYFTPPKKEASWRILWDATRRDQEHVSTALHKFEEQFTNREFIITGEIMHVIGIRLWLADIKAIPKSRAEVFQEVKTYIDDLFQDNKLETDNNEFASLNRNMGGYGGLCFREKQSDEYQELISYLCTRQDEALEDSYPEKAKILMQEMHDDTDLFFQRLCINNTVNQLYYEIPILSYIEPDDFVDQLLSLPQDQQLTVISVFKQRYEHTGFVEKLRDEIPWLNKVSVILRNKASKMDAIPKHAIENNIEWYIQPLLIRFPYTSIYVPLKNLNK
ncbi:MAG: hypothetical protein JKY92_00465 [Magnetovibrio sp.]|nr:hypothetical protein [Magnetovibrio sp.]